MIFLIRPRWTWRALCGRHWGTELFITGRLDQYRCENEKGDTVYDVSVQVEQFDFGGRPAEAAPKEDAAGAFP